MSSSLTRAWETLPNDYESVPLYSDSLPEWSTQRPFTDPGHVWARAKRLSRYFSHLNAEPISQLPRNPAGPTGKSGNDGHWDLAGNPCVTVRALDFTFSKPRLLVVKIGSLWCLPGGYVELTNTRLERLETDWMAAIRETKEEASIDIAFERIRDTSYTYPDIHRGTDNAWSEDTVITVIHDRQTGNSSHLPDPTPDGVETCDAKFVPLHRANRLDTSDYHGRLIDSLRRLNAA